MKTINFEKNSSEVHGRTAVSTRIFLDGEPGTFAPDRILSDGRFSLGMRALAVWVWGQSLSWVFRVEDIQERLGITRGQWRTLSKEMTHAGFMAQRQEGVGHAGGGIPTHCLVFYFTIFEGFQQGNLSGGCAPERLKTTTRVSGGKRPLAGGVRNMRLNPVFNNPSFKEPPPAPSGGSACLQEEELARQIATVLGLTGDAVERFCKACLGAHTNQLALIKPIVERTQHVRDRIGLCIGLAAKAARGELVQPQPAAVKAQGSDVGHELKKLVEWSGFVIGGPAGDLVRVEGSRMRCLTSGLFLHPADVLKLIHRVKAGELDARPP